MTLQLQNLDDAKKKLSGCNTGIFTQTGNSFRQFLLELEVGSFRHIANFSIGFEHPITVISGTNKIGKTSLLLLIACSHEQFMRMDSTSPTPVVRQHQWNDVLSFTSHETVANDYSYKLKWRLAHDVHEGEGKRLASSAAWSGLGKKSADPKRKNAKIRNREVRLIDLERILPGRSFSRTLIKKANSGAKNRLNAEVEQAFSYVFDSEPCEISEVGGHINKTCFIITTGQSNYSTYNAASGEESVIYLLKDIIESPVDSLILIDEIETALHPLVQRRVCDIIQYISWRDKKQFILTTHSPTVLSALPPASRRFVERVAGELRVIKRISRSAASSKMDSASYPLLQLYCEDDVAQFLIMRAAQRISKTHPYFDRLISIVASGPANEVRNDYERHKRNYKQLTSGMGYAAVLDGDKRSEAPFSSYQGNDKELVSFIYPYEAPEKFLVRAFTQANPNGELTAALLHTDHHSLFQTMVRLGLAVDEPDARTQCYTAFMASNEFSKHDADLKTFLLDVVARFSDAQE